MKQENLNNYQKNCFINFALGSTTYLSFLFFPLGFALSIFLNRKNTYSNYLQFFLGYFAISLHWLALSLLYADLFYLIPLASLPIIFLALSYSAVIYSSHKRFNNEAIVVLSWCICEHIQSKYVLGGFPWGLTCHSLNFNIVFMQGASVFGILGLSAITISIWQLPYILSRNLKRFVIYSLLILLYLVFSLYLIHNERKKIKYIHNVNVLHTYISPEEQFSVKSIRYLIKMTNDILSKVTSQSTPIIIWPENTFQYVNADVTKYISNHLANEHYLIFGSASYFKEYSYNSLYLTQNGKILYTYNKRHLVPMGEYIPEFIVSILNIAKHFVSKETFERIEYFIEKAQFTKGEANQKEIILNDILIYDSPLSKTEITYKSNKTHSISIIPSICYESIFPIKKNTKYTVVVNIVNDVWIQKSLAIFQHLEQARFRAVEARTGLIRSSNCGHSAIINSIGEFEYKKYNADSIVSTSASIRT